MNCWRWADLILLYHFFQTLIKWSVSALLIPGWEDLRIIFRNGLRRESTMHEWVLHRTRSVKCWKIAHIVVRNTQHLWVRIVHRLLRGVGLFESITQPLYIRLNCVWFLNKVLYLFCDKVSYFTDWNAALVAFLHFGYFLLTFWAEQQRFSRL